MRKIVVFAASLLLAMSCRKEGDLAPGPAEDTVAKEMLQGIWCNEDNESVALRVKGDTIYYPDPASIPVYFRIIGDTLAIHGAKTVKYKIVKQAPHLFVFENQSGDKIKLNKSENASDIYYFSTRKNIALNQRTLIKRDSVVTVNDTRYHYYIQVNPTTYKIVKTSYNEDGMAVDNIYYDNIIHLVVYQGANSLFSSNFTKRDFKGLIPKQYLSESILSDIVLYKVTDSGLLFVASLAVPDTPISFQVSICISEKGEKKLGIIGVGS